MARPLRIETPGAIYWVTCKGESDMAVFNDDADRRALLEVIAQAMQRFDAQVLAYCLEPDQYALLLFTRQANLSRLMRHVNGVFTQLCNRRHGDAGKRFNGRFKAVLVDRDRHLLDVCRHVDLGGVRSGVARQLSDWPWSSYAVHVGLIEAPAWLDVDGLHSYLLDKPVAGAADRRRAAQRYEKLLASDPAWDVQPLVRQQIFLGDAAFAARQLGLAAKGSSKGTGLANAAKSRKAKPWSSWLKESADREEALYRAYTEGGLAMTQLAQTLGLSVSRISRLISHHEQRMAV